MLFVISIILTLVNAALVPNFSQLVSPITYNNTPIGQPIWNSYWYTTLNVGLNKDKVKLLMDTGSWLTHIIDTNANCTGVCASMSKIYGTFDYNGAKSLTRKDLGQSTVSDFGGNYKYQGELVTDDIYFNNIKVGNLQFDDVSKPNSYWTGLLGLSRPPAESQAENIGHAAKIQGVIPKASYSFNLKNLDDSNGQFVLGGIDYGRIDGKVTWTSIANQNIGAYVDYININGTKVSVKQQLNYDTGTSIGGLPSAIYQQFVDSLPYDSKNAKGSGKIQCNLLAGRNITYNLNGADYTFPLKAIAWPDQTGTCTLAVANSSSTHIGGFVMRYLNVAINWDNETIGIASLKQKPTASNIIAI